MAANCGKVVSILIGAIILDSTLSSWTETIIEAFIRQVRFAVIA